MPRHDRKARRSACVRHKDTMCVYVCVRSCAYASVAQISIGWFVSGQTIFVAISEVSVFFP